MTKTKTVLLSALAAQVSVTPAFAHFDPIEHGSLLAGLSHPLFGADHVMAMVAVGVWAALLGGRAIWLVPLAFVGAMLTGFVVAAAGGQIPAVEPMILASVVVVGLLASVAVRVPTAIAMAMVGFFAFFHGHAHGGEIGQASAFAYAAGFSMATAGLHMAGALACRAGGASGRLVARVAGLITASGGAWLALAN